MTKFVKAVFHKDIRTIEFTAGNWDRMLRSGGTLAWLFNNPGNLRPKKSSPYPGQIGVGDTKYGKLCIFDSVETGRAEKRALLRRKYNQMTLRKAIYTYAPPDDNNDSEAYLSFVKKKTGLGDDVVLEDLSNDQLDSMMVAMEQMEGFNAKQETRKERWVHVTNVTLSDGARPVPNHAVTIERGDRTTEVTTDAFGRLPPFITMMPGERISLLIGQGVELSEKVAEFFLQARSQSIVAFRSGGEYRAPLASHNPRPANKATKPEPIRYVIQPRDTLENVAERFKVDARKLAADNKAAIKNPNRIFPGQAIWIYKEAGSATQSFAAKKSVGSPAPVKSVRSRENKGHSLGVIPLDQKRAPWMETAVAELKRWGGTKEKVIDDTTNYHKEIGLGFKSLATAWCASFVNYCLKTTGYKHSGSAGSQSFRWSPHFLKIKSPLYGALVVYSNPAKPGQGHVAFAYCKLKGGDIAVLGGNQGDSITFNSHKGVYLSSLKYKLQGYYVPVSYKEYAEKQMANGGDLGDEEYTLATLRAEFGKSAKVTKADENTR